MTTNIACMVYRFSAGNMEDQAAQISSDQLVASPHGEHSPLLGEETLKAAPQWFGTALRRYRTTRKCITSKVALLILLWSFASISTCGNVLNPDIYVQFRSLSSVAQVSVYGVLSIMFCFFPLAGCLADIKYGRSKVVICSSSVLLSGMALELVGFVILMITSFILQPQDTLNEDPLLIVGDSITYLSLLIILVGFVGFTANIVPFGMDQLHDSPGEDQSLFIHWYVWFYHVSLLFPRLAWSFTPGVYTRYYEAWMTGVYLSLIPTTLLIISLCVAHCRRRWFLIDSGRVNPYKLVYRVTKFAFQHRTPVRRSAFTYCEDELPSGLDLGKNKYGGPFTTEEVENVKTFYGILKVLFSFGTVFFLDHAAKSILPIFAIHDIPYHRSNMYDNATFNETMAHHLLISNGLLSPLLVVICIPLYLCLIRPFMSYYIPGMLKRMGIGMFLVLLSLMTTFTMDTVLHSSKDKEVTCMFRSFNLHSAGPFQDTTYLIVQHVLSALSNMLIYIGSFEFICSQSPHSMKGMLIGLWYAIKGLFELLATLLVVPFPFWKHSFPSCGFVYYLVNIVIGVFSLTVYVCVARRYKKRERDEPCNIRQYAEEYYSNPQQEPHYDYSISSNIN